MFRAFWTIATIVMCCGGVSAYSLMRVASLADAANDAAVIARDSGGDDDRKI